MKLSELYNHKADYEEILSLLYKYKDLPRVADMAEIIYSVLDRCNHYEMWGIDTPYWKGDISLYPAALSLGAVSEIHNQPNGVGYYKTITFNEPKNLMRIWFSSDDYVFGEDYPTLLHNVYTELKTECPPLYEEYGNKLYYEPKDAKKAYDTCRRLLADYHSKYQEESKKRRVKELEKELAKLKGEMG